MKTIGLLGGMSYESTLMYYKGINDRVKAHLEGAHSAKIIMYSYDYDDLKICLEAGQYEQLSIALIAQAKIIEKAGAQALVMCANTVHIVAQSVEVALKIPLIHIAKETIDAIQSKGLEKVLLLGTNYTMESDLYPKIAKEKKRIITTPNFKERKIIHDIIYHELIKGKFLYESKQAVLKIIDRLIKEEQIEGVILGCTELPLLIDSKDLHLPIFDTMQLHIEAAVRFIFS